MSNTEGLGASAHSTPSGHLMGRLFFHTQQRSL